MKCLVKTCNNEVTGEFPDGNPKRLCLGCVKEGWKASNFNFQTKQHDGPWKAFMPKDKAREVFKTADNVVVEKDSPSIDKLEALALQLEKIANELRKL